MITLEANRAKRLKRLICYTLLVLAVVCGASPAYSARTDPPAVSSWLPLSIPGLDTGVAVFAVARKGNQTLVGTREQGLFISDHSGALWTHPEQFKDFYVRDLWLSDDSASPVVLMATFGSGLWRSTNAGSDWSLIDAFSTPYHYSIALGQGGVQAAIFLATANNGVWKSTNLGAAWSQTGTIASPGAVALAAISDQEVFAGSVNNGLYRTANGGATWQQVGFASQTVRAVAIDPDSSERLLASVGSQGVYRVYKSENGGDDWTLLHDGLNDGSSILSLLITKVAGERYVLAGSLNDGVFRWDEDDDEWKLYGLGGRSVYELDSSGDTLYAGADGGVWIQSSTPEIRWFPLIMHNRAADSGR